MRARVLVLLSCLALGACSDGHDVDESDSNSRDDDQSSEEGAGSSDRDGGSGRGNAGEDGSGTGRDGGGNPDTTGGTGEPVFGDVSSCQPCAGAEGSMGALEPCCTADGECGLDIGAINGLGPTCAQQNAPGAESMSCPAYIFGENFDLTSCCGADGFCGVMIVMTAPLGCVDPRLLGDLVSAADGSGDGEPPGCGEGD
jgi:hypothetical protein